MQFRDAGTDVSGGTGSPMQSLQQSPRLGTSNLQSDADGASDIVSSSLASGETGAQARRRPTPQLETPRPNARTLHRTRAMFSKCIDDLTNAIGDGDIVERENSLAQFKETLGLLWDCNEGREEQYSEAVNMLQCLFEEVDANAYSTVQLELLIGCIARLRDESPIDDDLVNEIVSDLLEGGFDVFRELD